MDAFEIWPNRILDYSSTFSCDRNFFSFAGNENNSKVTDEFRIQPDPTMDFEVSCPRGLSKSPYTYDGRNVLTTLAPSFLIGTSTFLHETRTCIQA